MTALDKYTRLEAVGLWRESPAKPPTEVIVSFGDAVLLLSDFQEQPLSHWAMAATARISLEGAKAVYTPDTEGYETLEIDDAEMVEAIAQVARATTTPRRKKSVLTSLFLLGVLAVGGFATLRGPAFLRTQAHTITSPEIANKLGLEMLAALKLDTCSQTRANAARDLLLERVFPEGGVQLIITDGSSTPTTLPTAFPGGILIVGNGTLQAMRSPEQLAMLLQTLTERGIAEHATAQLFEGSSLAEIFTYVTTGNLPAERLMSAAKMAINRPLDGITLAIAPKDPPLLRDQDWVALQGICLN